MNNIKTVYLTLFCAIFIYYAFALNNQPGLAGDDAGYVIWAKSILQGGGLDYINEPVPRTSGYKLFALPLLLAPVLKFTDNLIILKIVPLFFSVCALLLFVYLSGRIFHSRRLIILSSLLLIYNGLFFDYSNQIMAENIFIFFSLLAVISAEEYRYSDSAINIYLPMLILFSAAAYFSRTAGIALILSVIIYFTINFELKKILSILTAFALFFVLVFYSAGNKAGSSETYFNIIKMKSQYAPEAGRRTAAETIKDSARKSAVYSLRLIPDAFLYPFFKNVKPTGDRILFAVQAAAGLFFSILIISGFVIKTGVYKINKLRLNIINSIELFDIYVLITILMLLVWQIYSSRYLLPILPFLIIYFTVGLNEICGYKRKIFKYAAAAIIITGFCGQLYLTYNSRNHKLPQEWRDYYETLDYLMTAEKDNLENINVACRKPLSYHLKSGYKLKTTGYPLSSNTRQIQNFMINNKIDYIVRDDFAISGPHTAEIYLDPYIENYSDSLTLSYISQNQKTRLYKIQN